MIARLRSWYGARTRRERHLLLLMLAVVLPILGWLLVAQVTRSYEVALREHLEAVDRRGRVQVLVDAARTRPAAARVAAQSADIGLVVTESAAQESIALEGATPIGSNAIEVRIGAAPATAVAQWFRTLDARGIAVSEMRMSPAGDQLVAVSARLARRG